MQSDVTYFTLREEQIIEPHDTFTLVCKFRTKKSALDSQAKLAESVVGEYQFLGMS